MMTTYTIDPAAYSVDLRVGSHVTRGSGMCLLEWLAYLANESHTDHPKCVCSVLGAMGRALNDTLPDDRRQELKVIGVNALGTRGDGYAPARAYMALDWLIRTYLPAWLDLTWPGAAERVRGLDRIVDAMTVRHAGSVVRWVLLEGRGSLRRDRNGRDVAQRVAARDAITQACVTVPVTAVWDAASFLSKFSVGGVVGDVVDEVTDAGRDAAEIAVWRGMGPSWDEGRIGEVLAPTVRTLEQSGIDLFAEMIKSPWDLADPWGAR